MTTYTIRTRGLIPGILKRGPMSGIKLDVPTLVDLLSRGVDIVDDSTGRQLQMVDVVAPRKKIESVPSITDKVSSVVDKAPEKIEVPPPVPVNMPLPEEVKQVLEDEAKTADKKPEAPQVIPESEPEKEPEKEEPSANGEKESEADTAGATAPAQEPPVPVFPKAADPYAGMSKNQRKKAQKAAAEAAAKATANDGTGTQN